MPRPHHRIHPATRVFLLVTSTSGLAWIPYSISRLTPRSVFICLRTGELQLCRSELESRGRVDTVSGTFSLEPWPLPRQERMAS